MAAVLYWYTNAGNSKGVLPYMEATHEEDLDGLDKLTVISRKRPNKHDKLVWQDNAGSWHEHIVDNTADDHAGHSEVRSECMNSIVQLAGLEAPGSKAKKTVAAHLESLLAGTQWGVGWCSNFGVVEIEYYHKNVRECISDLVSLTDGELVTEIEVGETGVTSRTVRIVRQRGYSLVKRAFTYKENMSRVLREVDSDEAYTRVVGYGAKTGEIAIQREIDRLEAIEDRTEAQDAELAAARERLASLRKNEYAERLKVVSASQLPLMRWGVPMADGTFAHNTYVYTDSNCTDAVFLRKQCDAIRAAVCRPTVRYRFDVAEVDANMWRDVQLGNKVLCIDRELGDVPDDPNAGEVKRITHVKRRLAGRMSCVIEIGERTNPLVDQFVATERVSRSATGNRSKVVARTPQFTGGNYSAGDYGYYDPQTDPATPEGTEQGIPKPYEIRVVNPPNRLDYIAGERIDYDGLRVQLFNQDGTVFTDSNYPDGVIPFQELILPPPSNGLEPTEGTYYVSSGGEVTVCTQDSNTQYEINSVVIPAGIRYTAIVTPQKHLCITAARVASGDFSIDCFQILTDKRTGKTEKRLESTEPSSVHTVDGKSYDYASARWYGPIPLPTIPYQTIDENTSQAIRDKTLECLFGASAREYRDGKISVGWKSKYEDRTLETDFTVHVAVQSIDIYRDGSGGSGGGKF